MAEEVADDVMEEFVEVQPLNWKEVLRHSKLPIIVWVVFITTLFACAFGGASFLLFSVAGYSWILCLAFAVMVIPANLGRMSFPVFVWLPWGLFVVLSGYMSDAANLQRSIMLLCPIVVGMAVSTAKIDEEQLINFGLLIKIFSAALLFLGAFLTGLLLTGELPGSTGLAPQAITATLLGAFFVAGYSSGRIKDLFWWGGDCHVTGACLDTHGNFCDGYGSPAYLFADEIARESDLGGDRRPSRLGPVLHAQGTGKNVHERGRHARRYRRRKKSCNKRPPLHG